MAERGRIAAAKAAASQWIEERVARVDKPWVWPLVEIVGALIAGLCFSAPGFWWGVLVFAVGAGPAAFGAWANHRRGVRISGLNAAHAAEVRVKDALIAEVQAALVSSRNEHEVASLALEKATKVVDDIVERAITRKSQQHHLTADDRVTWLLSRDDHLQVVGRYCQDPTLKAVTSKTYGRKYGLIGRAFSSQTVQWKSFDPTGPDSYENWQAKECRLPDGELSELGMRSREYRVIPVLDHSALEVLGIVVIESLNTGLHLDALADEMAEIGSTMETVQDLLHLIAQMPTLEEATE